MIIVISGEDTYRSGQYRDKIVTKFRAEKDPGGYNVIVIEPDSPVGTLAQELFSAPFLAEKRLVLVKNILGTKSSPLQAELLDILQNRQIPDSTVAVFWEALDEVKGKTTAAKIWEIFKKEKYKENFPLLAAPEAVTFFNQELSGRGCTADRKVAETAVACVGTESRPLILLADQLCAFKKDSKNITLADLQEFVTTPGDDNIFNLVDALIQGKVTNALQMMRAQYTKGEDEFFIFQMLIRQVRIMLMIADCLVHGETSSDVIAKKLGLHPFVAKKTIPLVKSFVADEIQSLFIELSDFDKRVKSGRGDLGILLDTLTVKLGSLKK